MAASESLREDQTTQDRGKENKQTWMERKFIIVNFLLIAILFLTSQPSAILWIYRFYSNNNPTFQEF